MKLMSPDLDPMIDNDAWNALLKMELAEFETAWIAKVSREYQRTMHQQHTTDFKDIRPAIELAYKKGKYMAGGGEVDKFAELARDRYARLEKIHRRQKVIFWIQAIVFVIGLLTLTNSFIKILPAACLPGL